MKEDIKTAGAVTAPKDNPESWPLVRQLLHIQQNLAVPKTQVNEEAGFSYRSVEDILSVVKPLLAKTGCIISFSEEIEEHGSARYVASTVTIMNQEGETFSTKALAREDEALPDKYQAQITGSCISYARKYAIGGLLAIDAGRKADVDAITPTATAPAPIPAAPSAGTPAAKPAVNTGKPAQPKVAATKTELKPGGDGWVDETLRVKAWKGTRDGYLNDLRTRHDVAEDAVSMLLSKRTKPFEGEKAAA